MSGRGTRRGRSCWSTWVALPEPLFESELVRTCEGRFHPRSDPSEGFELVDGGSLFLEEMANVPLPQQAELLCVLEIGDTNAGRSSVG